MASSSGVEEIEFCTVKRDGRQGTYFVAFDNHGVSGTETRVGRGWRPTLRPFALPWSDIRSITRRTGITSWGTVVELASDDSLELWVCYEHRPTSYFHSLQYKYGTRVRFDAEPAPLWKVLALPAIITCTVAGGGSWMYLSVRDAEAAGELGREPLLVALLGSKGVLLLLSFVVMWLLAYCVWLASREIGTKT